MQIRQMLKSMIIIAVVGMFAIPISRWCVPVLARTLMRVVPAVKPAPCACYPPCTCCERGK